MNSIENIIKIIYLLDKHTLKLLLSKTVDDDKVNVLTDLTDIRQLYIKELNNLQTSMNKRDMFDKKYYKSYKKSSY